MITTVHKADSRGKVDFGWLKSHHTFSFSSYYNPERVHFGALRVLNDDIVEPEGGFSTHGHENMEIISIPISGELSHKDSMGSLETIHKGEIQIMSAGTGVRHSELNHSSSTPVNFLQIWILPKKLNIKPHYGQKYFSDEEKHNRFKTVVSPESSTALWINQDAYFSIGNFDKSTLANYQIQKSGNGLYMFLISGKIEYENQIFTSRDGIGIESVQEVDFKILEDSEILLIEVPMKEFTQN